MQKKWLWFNWKDITHPEAGGAERVNQNIMAGLVRDGFSVTLVTRGYDGAKKEEVIDGVKIVRLGKSKVFHTFYALVFYLLKLKNKFDYIVCVQNTAPYLINLFSAKERVFLFFHQLAREVWFYEFPPVFSHIGYYLLEPLSLWLISKKQTATFTISSDTKNDLIKFGFAAKNITVIRQSCDFKASKKTFKSIDQTEFKVGFIGAFREMKRPGVALEVFKKLSAINDKWQFYMAGSGDLFYNIKKQSEELGLSIKFLGRISEDEKLDFYKEIDVLIFTSIKEGWGLTITESARTATPTVALEADGVRCAIKNGITGFVCKTTNEMASKIADLANNREMLCKIGNEAFEYSQNFTSQNSYEDFRQFVFFAQSDRV